MKRYGELKQKSAIFRSFTGLSTKAFQTLLPAFYQAYEDDLDSRDAKWEHKRQRERGGGRQESLKTMEYKLLFILFYLKFYPVQEVQGYLFGMGQAQAQDWIHRLTPILNRALGYEKQLPARKYRDIEQILAACPGLEFIIDGTERPIRRPKDKKKQESHYSGKKKRHAVKMIAKIRINPNISMLLFVFSILRLYLLYRKIYQKMDFIPTPTDHPTLLRIYIRMGISRAETGSSFYVYFLRCLAV